jgi:farnesyl diphosphate synthase
MTHAPFGTRIEAYHARLDAALGRYLPAARHRPTRLHEAMHYATEGGKRLRPLLVYAAGEALGAPMADLDAPACAVELIHAYSLVHDDLPAMDNDDLRRGRPTVHKQFDEATAILVGDGLQALAFHVLSHADGLDAARRLRMVEALAHAAGSYGMVGGQALDLTSEGKSLTLPELEDLHIHKTGALIRACLRLACFTVGCDDGARHEALDRYGKCVGLAFQIQDDVLDVEGSTLSLGKTAGKDVAHLKSTYVSVMGLPAAKQRATELFDDAREALAVLGETAEPLLWLASHIQGRQN